MAREAARAEADAVATRHAEALLAEEEAEKEAADKEKKAKKKKKGKGGDRGAGPSQEPVAAAGAADEAAGLAVAEEAELAAAFEESARLEEGRASARKAEEPPADFNCPITTEIMSDPVMAADGHAYERTAIERWLATRSTSPLTGGELEHTHLCPSHILRRQIREWQQAQL